MRAWIFLTVSSVWLLSCAQLHDYGWPQVLPPRAHFQALYQADPDNQRRQSEQEYLDWVINFYQGSLLYPTGWQDVEAAIVATVPPCEQAQQQVRLQNLGTEIAAEWAKHNDLRLIDNRLLSLWGSTLQLIPDSRQLSGAIAAISADIHAILALQLDPGDINPRRYEEMLKIQLFDDF